MKKQGIFLLSVIIIVLLGGLGYFYIQNSTKISIPSKISHPPTPTNQQTSPTVSSKGHSSPAPVASYCTPQNLQASVNLSPGAGNIYGTFTLKNISHQTCQVLGGNFISVVYDTNTVKNITVTHIGQTQSLPFTLSPNQELYSQVHYPNGPQCNSIGINVTNITFTYKVSPTDTVTFKNQNGNVEQGVQTCKSLTDRTEIQIWNMANQPISS